MVGSELDSVFRPPRSAFIAWRVDCALAIYDGVHSADVRRDRIPTLLTYW